jgi:hypothetical protein
MSARIHGEGVQDQHAQLRALYQSLLQNQEHFDEFKQLLAGYPTVAAEEEPDGARAVREVLNARIRTWVGDEGFHGLSAKQVLLWRAIVVDERFNVALSPWKESNLY